MLAKNIRRGIWVQNRPMVGWDLEQVLQKITFPILHVYRDWRHGSAVREEDAVYLRTNQL
jgi:hypothetical protein